MYKTCSANSCPNIALLQNFGGQVRKMLLTPQR